MKLIFSFFLLATPLFAEIIEIESITPIWQQSSTLTSQDLVVFDVDRTLIIPKDAILHPKNDAYRAYLKNKYIKTLPKPEQDKLLAKLSLQREVTLIDPSIVSFICQLQNRGVQVIAETAMRTGRVGEIENIEDWRNSELLSLGLDFRRAFPNQRALYFNQFLLEDHLPGYKDGIIYSASANKGKLLIAFLKQVNFKPKRVIFVDDLKVNVEAVDEALADEGIEVTAYYYREAYKLPSPLDKEIAERQVKHLIKTGVWLSDCEAMSHSN